MNQRDRLYRGFSRAAWGYFIIYFNIYIGSVSLLPTFVGFMLFSSAIKALAAEERELSLLRPLCLILGLYHAADWLACWFGVTVSGLWQPLDIIIAVVNLYFHYQLMTNLASIIRRHPSPPSFNDHMKIIGYRNVQTVMLTAILALSFLAETFPDLHTVVTLILLIVDIIASLALMMLLFRIRRRFRPDPEDGSTNDLGNTAENTRETATEAAEPHAHTDEKNS